MAAAANDSAAPPVDEPPPTPEAWHPNEKLAAQLQSQWEWVGGAVAKFQVQQEARAGEVSGREKQGVAYGRPHAGAHKQRGTRGRAVAARARAKSGPETAISEQNLTFRRALHSMSLIPAPQRHVTVQGHPRPQPGATGGPGRGQGEPRRSLTPEHARTLQILLCCCKSYN